MRISLVYPRLFPQVRSFLPPLGLISLGTVLKESGFDVTLVDGSFRSSLGRVKRELLAARPVLAGFSCTTDLVPSARRLIAYARSLGAFTVAGGPHATLEGAKMLQEIPALDAVVCGEGELTMRELATALEKRLNLEDIPGLIFRRGDSIVVNRPREWIADLDGLPMPDRRLLPTYGRYSASGFTGLVLSRGCPHHCRFCQPALTTVAGTFRRYSPRRVVDEIEQLYRTYGNRTFHVDDDLFVLDRKWIAEIRALLAERGLLGALRFIVLCRVDVFDDEMAELLKSLGASYLMFGLESGSQAVLDAFRKSITLDRTLDAFARARRFGFHTHAFVILGSPYETRESLAETEAFVERVRPDSLFLARYVPMPGTHIREELEAEGRVDIRGDEQVNYFNWAGAHLLVKNEAVSFEDVRAARDRILLRRRARFFLFNARQAVGAFLEKPSLRRLVLLWMFWRKKSDFNG